MKDSSKDILLLIALILVVSLPWLPSIPMRIFNPPQKYGIEMVIQINLHSTYTAILSYLEENGKYPPAENWQDLLSPHFFESYKFKLPSKTNIKNTIALNPKAEPNSPGDVVLLFESTGGWNAQGQSELLTPTSNGKPGCYILFNDGNIKFVSPEQAKNLNWGNKP